MREKEEEKEEEEEGGKEKARRESERKIIMEHNLHPHIFSLGNKPLGSLHTCFLVFVSLYNPLPLSVDGTDW